MFDRDKFNNIDLTEVRHAAFAVINAMQGYSPEAQVGAGAVIALLLTSFRRMPLQDVLSATERMMMTADGRHPEFKAIIDYMENELK